MKQFNDFMSWLETLTITQLVVFFVVAFVLASVLDVLLHIPILFVFIVGILLANVAFKGKLKDYKPTGTKDMGYVSITGITQLDVIFISYNEPNAEKNWLRVLEKSPKAFRINGIKGIVNAHKCAAELATTDMFYVVDGDAYLTDEWSFAYQPSIFDRDCVLQ